MDKSSGTFDIVFGLVAGFTFGILTLGLLGPNAPKAGGESEETVTELNRVRAARALQESADFVNHEMDSVKSFHDRWDLLRHALRFAPRKGLYCEFGVAAGRSVNHIASIVPNQQIHGFDSFEGLPESWRDGHKIGDFSTGGKLPSVKPNVVLHKGWFDKTVPVFKQQFPDSIAFMHMDADLYSSTKTVFDILGDRIVPGTVIVFDEFFNYPGWQQGEYKAFQELASARHINYDYLGYSHAQVAIQVRGFNVP